MLKYVETKNSKKLGSATGAVLQYTTELITGFFPLVNWNIYESGNVLKSFFFFFFFFVKDKLITKT